MTPNTCSFDGCESPVKVKSLVLCGGHYAQHSKGRELTPIVKYPATCTIPDCGIKSHGKGLCMKHHQRKFFGRPMEDPLLARDRPCSIDGCDAPSKVRGWCEIHYARWKTHGDPTKTRRILGDDAARVQTHFKKTPTCWIWTAAKSELGYGIIRVAGKNVPAHRFVYELHRGKIPSGLHIDHICHNPSCVNPSHLRPATDKENGENRGALNSNNASGYRGVHQPTGSKKWEARVMSNRKWHLLGRFDTPEEANEVATAKRNELFTFNNLDRASK